MAKPPQRKYMPGPAAQGYMAYDYLFGPNANWARRAKQFGAGLHELVTADVNPEAGSYKPAFIPQIASIPAVVKSFMPSGQANMAKGKDKGPFSGDNAVERFLNESYKELDIAEKAGSELTGTTGVQNLDDLAWRYGISSLIRGPIGLAMGAGKAGKVGKIAKAVEKIGEKVPTYIKAPAKVVAEIATPFRQTKLKTAAPLNAGILGATDVLMDKGVDSYGQEYDGSIPEIVQGLSGRDVAKGDTPEEQAAMQEIEQQVLDDAYEAGDISDEDVETYINEPFTEAETEADIHSQGIEKAKDAGLWLAGSLAVLAGGHGLSRIAKAHGAARLKAVHDPANMGKFKDPDEYGPNASIDVDAGVPTRSPVPEAQKHTALGEEPQFIGTKYEKSDIGLADRAIGGAFEKTRPITTMAERYLGRNMAKKMGFKLDALSNSSIQARFHDWLVTGRAPGTEMKTEKLAAWARTYATELDANEQKRVGDALVAASSLDDHKRTGARASLFEDKFGNPTSVADMQALVDSVKQDPKLGKYYNQIQKFYDEKLQYEVARGTMTKADYDEMRKNRPNYVPLQSNLQQQAPYSPFGQRYSANEESKLARNLDPETGVKGSEGVVNPMSMLFEDWSDAIRRAETNQFRNDFLERMHNAGARKTNGQLVVEKLRPNATHRNSHEVNTPTGMVKYGVNDSELAKSLHLSPRETVKGLEEARQMYQNFTTGAVATGRNLFGLAAAPIMDSMAASTLAGKSHKVGLANRLFAGGHIGGIRAAGDAMAREFAIKMRTHMIRENSWIKNFIGEKGLDAFTTMLENHYKNTTLASMDQMGITSKAAWGSADPTHVMEGLQGVVPEYARQQAQRSIDDINEALDNDSIGAIRGRMSKIGNRWVQAKTLPFIRQYSALLESMHNGARYSAVRANKGKVKDLDEFISDMRRLSADPSIHGSSKAINYLASSNLYGPISLATMAQVGKRAREDPLNFLRQTTQTGMTAAAMFYLSQYYDQEARDAHAAKSPQQRANKLSLFGGAELPLDQLQRLVLGSVMPITDQISGMNTGEWNDDFLGSMKKMIEGRGPPVDEKTMKEEELRINEALRANMPTSLLAVGLNLKPDGSIGMDWKPDASSIPPLAGLAALLGLDPGMSTLTGEVVAPRTQEITGMDEGEARPDSLTSAFGETMIRTLFSSAGAGVLDVGNDAWRVLHDKDPDNDKRLGEIVRDQWKEGAQKGAGPLKGVLFGDRTQLKSAADTNYTLLKDREKGIEAAANVLERDYRTSTHTGASRSGARIARELDPSGTASRTDIKGTEALRIGSSAKQIMQENIKSKDDITNISKVIASIKASTDKTQEQKNEAINPLVDEIKYRRMMILERVRRHEETISRDIGRPFSFEDYDPEEYMNPYVKQQ